MSKIIQVVTYKSVLDEEKLSKYAALAGPAMMAAGGRILARGMPVADLRQPSDNSNVRVCVKVKSQSFLNDFFSTVFGLPRGDF